MMPIEIFKRKYRMFAFDLSQFDNCLKTDFSDLIQMNSKKFLAKIDTYMIMKWVGITELWNEVGLTPNIIPEWYTISK